MRAVDKGAEIVRAAIKTRRREQIDAVIAPPKPAGKVGDRHEFEASDPELGERGQFTLRRLPSPLRGEGADMHLVDNELVAATTAPSGIAPLEQARIDDLRGAVRTVRLKVRCGIGIGLIAIVGPEAIAHSRTGFLHTRRDIAARFG